MPPEATTLRPAHDVSEFALDDHIVLHSRRSSGTFVLNPTAAYVWKELRAGGSYEAVTSELTRLSGQSKVRVRNDIDDIIADWVNSGLLAGIESEIASADVRCGVKSNVNASLPGSSPARPPLEFGATYRILDFVFRIETSDISIHDDAENLLAHLRVATADGDCPPTRLIVERISDGWQLSEERHVLASCTTRDGIVPVIHAFTMMLAYRRSESFAAIHGAAVSSADRCVLMPAKSGSGKSTLTAALIGKGFACCSDDMAVLAGWPLRLRPVPVRIGLKAGSWDLLKDRLPGLRDLRPYLRDDGQQVKYLLPPGAGRHDSPDSSVEVSHLVFPRYSAAGNNRLAALPRGVAFDRLTAAGYDVPRRVSEDWVSSIVGWLRDKPCYALEYSNLDAAVERLQGLLA